MLQNGRLAKAIEAAISVLDTLSPNDYFGAFAFETNILVSPGCFGNEVAIASPRNIAKMKEWVYSLKTGWSTYYGKAFQHAMDMLSNR